MNKFTIIFSGISFVVGAAASGLVSHIITKKKCEDQFQKEINDIWNDLKNESKRREEEAEAAEYVENAFVEKPDLFEYANKIQQEQEYEQPDDLQKTNDAVIHEISMDEMDEEEYDREDMTLYADGIVADEHDIPLRTLWNTVGDNILEVMHGKDEVIIRNEQLKIDYDICRSQLTYGELLERFPETAQRLQYNDSLEDYYENKDEEDDEDEEEEEE